MLDDAKISRLHQMVAASGITDPLGFFFDDDPSQPIPSSRKIAIVENTDSSGRWGISRYLVQQDDGTLAPTLLKVPDNYLDPRYQQSLENYLKAYLNITSENEDRVFIFVDDPVADLRIMIKDKSSDDAVILVFDYRPPTGIAQVNVIHATIHYRYDEPGVQYYEAVYQTIEDELKDFGFLTGFFSIIVFPLVGLFAVIMIIPMHATHEHQASKQEERQKKR